MRDNVDDYRPDDGGSKHLWKSVSFCQTTRRSSPEERDLRARRRETPKSHRPLTSYHAARYKTQTSAVTDNESFAVPGSRTVQQCYSLHTSQIGLWFQYFKEQTFPRAIDTCSRGQTNVGAGPND
jgi:hypothetical protein